MHRRFRREFRDGDLPDLAGEGIVRRSRRHTPPGERPPVYKFRSRRRKLETWTSVQIGDVIAELTPRQAVVWLLNFDTMVSLYESTTGQNLDEEERDKLVSALRTIIRERNARPR